MSSILFRFMRINWLFNFLNKSVDLIFAQIMYTNDIISNKKGSIHLNLPCDKISGTDTKIV